MGNETSFRENHHTLNKSESKDRIKSIVVLFKNQRYFLRKMSQSFLKQKCNLV